MFQLPRSLNPKDEIEICGTMTSNPRRLSLNLITGRGDPDYLNIACQVEANFLEGQIILRSIENGKDYPEVLEQHTSDLFPDSEFNFIIKVTMNGRSVDINIGESYAGTVELKHNLQDIRFLTISDDVKTVEILKFVFAN